MKSLDDLAKLMMALKCEPAEGGDAIISVRVPKELAPMIPGLLLAGRLQKGMTDELAVYFDVFGKMLMNAFDGKHSDSLGNAVEAAE